MQGTGPGHAMGDQAVSFLFPSPGTGRSAAHLQCGVTPPSVPLPLTPFHFPLFTFFFGKSPGYMRDGFEWGVSGECLPLAADRGLLSEAATLPLLETHVVRLKNPELLVNAVPIPSQTLGTRTLGTWGAAPPARQRTHTFPGRSADSPLAQ